MLRWITLEIKDRHIIASHQHMTKVQPAMKAGAHRGDSLLKDGLKPCQNGRFEIQHLRGKRFYFSCHLRVALAHELQATVSQADVAVIKALPVKVVKRLGRERRIWHILR